MAQLVARRYATALFDVAKELNKIDEFEAEIKQLRSIFENEKELMQVMEHPQILLEKKVELIQTILEGKVADEIMGLLVLMVKKRRHTHMIDVLDEFLAQVRQEKGIITAEVISAIPMQDEQLTKVKQNIEKGTNKQVQIQTTIDESIMGGLIIRVGDKVVDASIAGKLKVLKSDLMDLQLA